MRPRALKSFSWLSSLKVRWEAFNGASAKHSVTQCISENAFSDFQSDSNYAPSRMTPRWVGLFLYIGIPFYLYLSVFVLPHLPLLLGSDQVFLWTYALRMYHGEHVYSDFFQFKPPGSDFIYLALFKLFGPRVWVTNAAVMLLGLALCWTCFSIAKRLMKPEMALITSLFFTVNTYVKPLTATHHWYSLLAALLALRTVMPGRTPLRIALAGVLFGIASFITQTVGVAGAGALLLALAWESFLTKKTWRVTVRFQFLLIASFVLTLAALNAPFLMRVGWRQLWYLQMVYPRYVPYWFRKPFPGLPHPVVWRQLLLLAPFLFMYAILPVIYLYTPWKCWRERQNPSFRNNALLALLSLTGLFLLLEIFPAVNWLRIYAISMPATVLLFWRISTLGPFRRYITAAAWIVVVCLVALQFWARHRQDYRVADLPAGKALLPGPKYEVYDWIIRHTSPGDLFLQTAEPAVYLPLDLRSPVYVDGLTTDELTRPEWIGLTVRQVQDRKVKYILASPWLYMHVDPSRPWEDHLGPFRAYLRSHYTRVHVFSDQEEIWERR